MIFPRAIETRVLKCEVDSSVTPLNLITMWWDKSLGRLCLAGLDFSPLVMRPGTFKGLLTIWPLCRKRSGRREGFYAPSVLRERRNVKTHRDASSETS